ncbi:hypothetical protein C8F04DRAFT_1303490 [Mycena alexandri]|uniref:Uncharacterized protein n=1 Tax=Mycena alexandri TaxID=1745969 RepID=A0AAD6WSQ3_9AGAR|nr:hypothetical protein C8F04DRAFT_1303490 [Mycena alexandri]
MEPVPGPYLVCSQGCRDGESTLAHRYYHRTAAAGPRRKKENKKTGLGTHRLHAPPAVSASTMTPTPQATRRANAPDALVAHLTHTRERGYGSGRGLAGNPQPVQPVSDLPVFLGRTEGYSHGSLWNPRVAKKIQQRPVPGLTRTHDPSRVHLPVTITTHIRRLLLFCADTQIPAQTLEHADPMYPARDETRTSSQRDIAHARTSTAAAATTISSTPRRNFDEYTRCLAHDSRCTQSRTHPDTCPPPRPRPAGRPPAPGARLEDPARSHTLPTRVLCASNQHHPRRTLHILHRTRPTHRTPRLSADSHASSTLLAHPTSRPARTRGHKDTPPRPVQHTPSPAGTAPAADPSKDTLAIKQLNPPPPRRYPVHKLEDPVQTNMSSSAAHARSPSHARHDACCTRLRRRPAGTHTSPVPTRLENPRKNTPKAASDISRTRILHTRPIAFSTLYF